jgi:hypothetical protein
LKFFTFYVLGLISIQWTLDLNLVSLAPKPVLSRLEVTQVLEGGRGDLLGSASLWTQRAPGQGSSMPHKLGPVAPSSGGLSPQACL